VVQRLSANVRIAVVIGSARPDNYTKKVADLVIHDLEGHPDVSVDVVDPRELELFAPGHDAAGDAAALKERIAPCTAVVIATPEYHGSFSAITKLVIENLGFPSALKGKPVALLGVASGQIGAVKALEHLRSVCSHVGALVLPGPVSVANVLELFDDRGNCTNPKTEARIRELGESLLDYIRLSICPALELEAMVRENEGKAAGG
jgi:FMN reductase